ncbi:hypothetical protein ACHAWF_004815 [Thalassiosira exigua]
MLRTKTFVATADNARPFEAWNQTSGFESSSCELPFFFKMCAVNCHLQAYTGKGCSSDDWFTEYNAAKQRLLQYNIIFFFEKLNDSSYVEAIEYFFGVKGFNSRNSIMWCGPESKKANEKVKLNVTEEDLLKLAKLNEMDNQLYLDLVATCSDGKVSERGRDVNYSFPIVDTRRLIAQENRTVCRGEYWQRRNEHQLECKTVRDSS